MTDNPRFTALYMRLSKEDGVLESASISSQRKLLTSFAKEHGLSSCLEYTDDGFSGTNFARPGFARMISDIESGKIHTVITKDLSRLGRDYIVSGQLTEVYFPKKGVRYIAIDDSYDSSFSKTDIVPFKNVLNEMYARDISKKIRSALSAHMHSGSFIGAFAPYGYMKDPKDKHHLIPDPVSSAVVRDIFCMAASGLTPTEIARDLNSKNILSPSAYRVLKYGSTPHVNPDWTCSTISKMLKNTVYLGHMSQGKTTKPSFKSPAVVITPADNIITVKNTHESLVDEETFTQARRRQKSRTCSKKGAFQNIFSGLAVCAGCGSPMSSTGSRKNSSPANLVCSNYKAHGKEACSNHFIDYNVLYNIVQTSLKEQLAAANIDKHLLITEAETPLAPSADETELLKKRLVTIDRITKKLYEDFARGSISPEQMDRLLKSYHLEYQTIEKRLSIQTHSAESHTKIDGILDANTLTRSLLFSLIDRIEIEQGHYKKSGGMSTKSQTVRIFYRFKCEPTVVTT